MLKTALRLALLAAALTSLGACAEHKAPTIDGVCYHMVENKDGSLKFNPLADHVPNIETCAQRLEIMRSDRRLSGPIHLAGAGRGFGVPEPGRDPLRPFEADAGRFAGGAFRRAPALRAWGS